MLRFLDLLFVDAGIRQDDVVRPKHDVDGVVPALHDVCGAAQGAAASHRVDVDQETGAKLVKDIKEQDVYWATSLS